MGVANGHLAGQTVAFSSWPDGRVLVWLWAMAFGRGGWRNVAAWRRSANGTWAARRIGSAGMALAALARDWRYGRGIGERAAGWLALRCGCGVAQTQPAWRWRGGGQPVQLAADADEDLLCSPAIYSAVVGGTETFWAATNMWHGTV